MSLTAFKNRVLRLLLAYAPELYALLRRENGKAANACAVRKRGDPQLGGEGGRPCVLLVDHDYPELGRDAGSKAIFHLAGILNEKARVTFWSASSSPSAEGKALLQSTGIRVAARQDGCDLAQWLGTLTGEPSFDAVIVSRPIIAAMYAGVVRKHVTGVCAYYGHDIHHVRLACMKEFSGSAGLDAELREIGRIERRLWRVMDVVFYPSDEEVGVVNALRADLGLKPNAVMLPLWDAPKTPATVAPASARKGMVFVGSHDHAPNIDGLNWFFREVLPEVRKRKCQDAVYVVGSGMGRYKPPTDDPRAVVLGRIDDEALDKLYAEVRVALVPLRYGAGVKGKVIEAMGKGVPCLTTPVGVQGLGWALKVLRPFDTAHDFASAIIEMMRDDALWQEKSREGLRLISATYERSAISRRLFDALGLSGLVDDTVRLDSDNGLAPRR
jgi:hypothetical protein